MWAYEIIRRDATEIELLEALLKGDPFAYSYVAPYPDPEVDGERVHGPFIIRHLTVRNFHQTTLANVTETIEHFLTSGQAPRSLDDLSLDSASLMPLRPNLTAYELRGPESIFHRMGELIGDYSDFVVIDRQSKNLKEVVLGYD